MTSKIAKIYWDSTAFICFLRKIEDERRKICEDILYHARDGRVNLYTSTFTVAEVIRPHVLDIARTRLLSAEEVGEIQEMFMWPWLKKIDLDQRVARQAVELERDYALGIADSIHAASAIVAKVDVLQHWASPFHLTAFPSGSPSSSTTNSRRISYQQNRLSVEVLTATLRPSHYAEYAKPDQRMGKIDGAISRAFPGEQECDLL
jgi:predicted nucleic acid-binding protein